MSTLLHPVGPHRPAVYWRRRVVLFLVVVAVVAVLWTLLGGGAEAGQDGQEGGAGATASDTASSATASLGGVGAACAPEDLAVTVSTDATAYGSDDVPRFVVAVASSATAPCTVDVGAADAVELVVTSGSDRIWSSADCRDSAPGDPVSLAPGATEDISVSWQRLRSTPDCADDLPDVRPGTYQVTPVVGGEAGEPAVFTLG
ncbi:hypothetical protein ACFP6A_01550 [Quadrisphaera sp. GCM10027208]|uniref:hypothetical protein n=1 Tax=Quadrisphaera sp. GCM10027208 TaxID=3273423 RepID=UPI003605CF8B